MLNIDRGSPVVMHRQLYDSLRSYIMEGRLAPDSRLPPTRTLAEQLGIGRNTVITAYDQLLAEGLIEARPGSGTRVATLLQRPAAVAGRPARPLYLSHRGELLASRSQPARHPGKINLQPGVPESTNFPFAAWAKLLARNARKRTDDILGYEHFGGHPRLRQAIAEYIGIARGVDCKPEQVIVVTGAQAGLDLAVRMLLDEGDDVWMEEPGYLGARNALLAGGARLFPMHVDREGWKLDDRQLPKPDLIYVTPSCHWPLGSIMRMEERQHLLAIAGKSDAWIIEDDYDGEYRLRGRPVPALRGLDPSGRVIYVGTFGKTLFASLRLGFLVVPYGLAEAFDRAVSITGHFAPMVLQCALSDFILEGHFASHLKRMRRLYARRQKEFVELCNNRLGRWLKVSENDSGMQVTGRFVRPFDDIKFAAAALRRGVHVQPLSINFHYDKPEHGLLLGFAALDERETRRAVAALQAAFEHFEQSAVF
jgi:GntR family transcriptional regulator/MocR family aminotransferase